MKFHKLFCKPPRYENSNPPPPYNQEWLRELSPQLAWVNYAIDVGNVHRQEQLMTQRRRTGSKIGLIMSLVLFTLVFLLACGTMFI